MNVPAVEPAVIVREAGTISVAPLSDREIRVPPAGAALLSVTVQVLVPPDKRLVGAQTKLDTWAKAVRLIEAVLDADP